MGIAGGGGALWWMALSSAAFWLLSSLLVGLLANRVPERWLQTSPRWQGDRAGAGGPAERRRRRGVAGIRRWKRWIPDAGPALPGGIAKTVLVGRDPGALQRLLIETRRAELVHVVLWGAGLLTILWLPPAGVLVNLLFAVAFNLPCLLLQRFNRRRVEQCLQRARGRGRDRPHASQ